MGDSGQGPVLPGQVQGVKAGAGVNIALDGTITFNSSSATGVVRTNNPAAYNSYVWPAAPINGGQLFVNSTGILSWGRVPGFGLMEEGIGAVHLKAALPVSATPPTIGTGLEDAPEGGLYWNSESNNLSINVGGSWLQASFGPADLDEALLTGTYTLYVNSQIGSDVYVTGIYDNTVVPVITNQMTQAGYTAQKPFKTISRAALEVARVQNGAGFNPTFYDRFVIHCSAGVHIVDNNPGSNSVSTWTNNQVPTDLQLQHMNSAGTGGIILPRGVSIIGEDLRKTIIRPLYVPEGTGNIEDDRAAIFRITGGAFFFNFSFKDKLDYNFTHHLLDCFSFVSDADLENYYNKVQVVFQQIVPDFVANPGETEIVAPQPFTSPNTATDGIIGSSPYIFNCSIRSKYGLCGINADGLGVTGFKSMVVSQFTGVSLQKDLTCWQQYSTTTKVWENTIFAYNTYVELTPNNIRMDPAKRSFHIRAINDAFIQEVSVFAIGQGVHHWTHSGGEISITNSNSSFGGCAGIAQGYKQFAFPQDTDWNTSYINVATNLQEDTNNISRTYLGTVASFVADNTLTIVLTEDLINSELYPGTPEILASKEYTFKPGSYLWVENFYGYDFRAPLDTIAWDPDMPNQISITARMNNQQGTYPGQASPGGVVQPNLAGNRVYIRRLVDTRAENRRKYSIDVSTDNPTVRTPLRDYVLQTTPGDYAVVGTIPDENVVLVTSSASIPPGTLPSLKRAQLVLERGNPSNNWSSGNFYRPGDTVKKDKKHYTCILQNSDLIFDEYHWSESYVHMASDYNAYDFFGNVAPIIIFNNDTDGDETSTTCGYNLTTAWTTDTDIIRQYTTATDYRGVYQFLVAMGFTPSQVTTLLTPSLNQNRRLNPASSSDMRGFIPDGAAIGLSNWGVQLRRPSIVRMFGHAWEWSGYLNYTKALPPYQGELSAQNQFNYYFTNDRGGKVYATGYNQEGYLISPAGITDLTTNTTTGIANIGSQNQGEFPNSFESLTVNNLTINGLVSGAPTFSPSFYLNLLTAGLGINFSAPTLKLEVPVSSSPPIAGNSTNGAIDGSLYWDNTLGTLFIRYNDGNSTQWVEATPSGGGGSSAYVIVSSTPPSISGLPEGSLYWNSNSGILYVLYNDSNSTQWVQVVPTGGSSTSQPSPDPGGWFGHSSQT